MPTSIVVVAYESWPLLGDCLTSIAAFPPDGEFEVIVVDNASRDGTADHVRSKFPDITLIASKTNDGYGVAVNRAMSVARGDHLVFLNPDARVTAGSLDRLIEFSKSPYIGIVGPRLLSDDGSPQPSGRRFPSPWRTLLEVSRLHLLIPRRPRADYLLGTYWDQSSTKRVDWVSGACHVMRRDVWNTVGPLTEATFCGFDDFEYCWRAAHVGLETWLVAESIVVHSVGTSVATRWKSSEVEELAINNMFVLLQGLWPRWRQRLLALAEASAAFSDLIECWLGRKGKEAVVSARSRMLLLLRLAVGLAAPIPRWGAPGVLVRS